MNPTNYLRFLDIAVSTPTGRKFVTHLQQWWAAGEFPSGKPFDPTSGHGEWRDVPRAIQEN